MALDSALLLWLACVPHQKGEGGGHCPCAPTYAESVLSQLSFSLLRAVKKNS